MSPFFVSEGTILLLGEIAQSFISIRQRTRLHLFFVGKIGAARSEQADIRNRSGDAFGDVAAFDIFVFLAVFRRFNVVFGQLLLNSRTGEAVVARLFHRYGRELARGATGHANDQDGQKAAFKDCVQSPHPKQAADTAQSRLKLEIGESQFPRVATAQYKQKLANA
jgi:hypothetical protein